MTRYPPAPVAPSWDRWHQPHAGPDYGMMQVDSMVSYDPRPVPSTTALQRPTMAPQYTVGTSYADSPVTPMSSSPYGSQGHFGEYPPCTYQSPTVPSSSTAFPQLSQRVSHRPLAPPTPPLDEERGMRVDADRSDYPMGGTGQRSSRRSVTAKPEMKEGSKEIKTVPKFVKSDGTLQYTSTRKVDVVLKLAEEKIRGKSESQSGANTPESMGSPMASLPEEEVFGSVKLIDAINHANDVRLAQARTAQAGEETHLPGRPMQTSLRAKGSTRNTHASPYWRETLRESFQELDEQIGESDRNLGM